VPTEDGSMLEFGGGVFGAATRFAAVTRKLCFGRGEGLPGHAWESGKPIVLNQLEGSYFRRADVARAEGLTSGIALPIFKGRDLTAVLVIFCGDDDAHAGAIELWGNDPGESKDLSLVDGYYGTTGDTFEFISRSTSFRRGTGLPGLAWERNVPVFFEDLGKGSGFLRADGAIKVGINRGFAVPCSTLDGSHFVMAFLSALATPIARRVEIWVPGFDGRLQRAGGFSEDEGRLQAGPAASDDVTDAYTRGVPVATDSMIAIPVSPQGRTTAAIALYF
jgi:hypothetical protein